MNFAYILSKENILWEVGSTVKHHMIQKIKTHIGMTYSKDTDMYIWGAGYRQHTDRQTDRQNMGRCCHLPRCKGIPELATSEGCSSDIGDTEDRTITNHTAILRPPHCYISRLPSEMWGAHVLHKQIVRPKGKASLLPLQVWPSPGPFDRTTGTF